MTELMLRVIKNNEDIGRIFINETGILIPNSLPSGESFSITHYGYSLLKVHEIHYDMGIKIAEEWYFSGDKLRVTLIWHNEYRKETFDAVAVLDFKGLVWRMELHDDKGNWKASIPMDIGDWINVERIGTVYDENGGS